MKTSEIVKKTFAGELISLRLSRVEGLSHLSAEIERFAKILIEKINDRLVNILVVEPFETHVSGFCCFLFEVLTFQLISIIRTIPEQRIQQNHYCSSLFAKSRGGFMAEPSKSRLRASLQALAALEEKRWDIDRLMMLCKNMIDKMVRIERGSSPFHLCSDRTHRPGDEDRSEY